MPHIYIAAAHKSSGKTTVSIGLAAALTRRGHNVQPFKKGPDYIDPLWLSKAAGKPCYNLDFFTQSHEEILKTFNTGLESSQIGLIEGNKGLFDGVDVEGSDSNAALATLLGSPVILVIDTGGITRGIAPLIQGYLSFDKNVNIAGVILNKVASERHENKLRAALERYTDIEILGAVGRNRNLEIPERHLGLIPANETRGVDAAQAKVSQLADAIENSVNLDRIISLANKAHRPEAKAPESVRHTSVSTDIRIAVARDAAFGFYYQDDLEAFERLGAKIIPFDTLQDPHLPVADGLFIGGGFPETHLDALSANQSLMTDIRHALEAGMPAYAECGGLMYLSRQIRWKDDLAPMVGAIPADVVVEARPQGRGYMLLEETEDNPWPQLPKVGQQPIRQIPVHEFHYARLENLEAKPVYAQKVLRGSGIDGHSDGLLVNNLIAGFAHHRNTLANPWVSRFLDFVRQNR